MSAPECPETVFFKSCLAVFQGGGCRGAAHAGAYDAATLRGVRFSRVAGTSAGSIVAALLGAGATPAFVLKALSSLDFSKFLVKPEPSPHEVSWIDKWIKRWALRAVGQRLVAETLRWGGQYSSKFIEEWIDERLRELLPDVGDVRFRHLKIPTYIVATDLLGLEPRVWSKSDSPDDRVAFAVRASCSIPGFFQPVVQGSNRFVDGGVLSNLPAFVFKEESPDWRLQPERILAFRLKAGYESPTEWSTAKLVSMLAAAAIEGATEIQTALQGNIHVITIPTEDIVATDFDKLNQADTKGERTNVNRLIEWGRKATHQFLRDEIQHVTKASPPIQALLDPYEVYQAGVQHADYRTYELIIVSETTRWVWDLFPMIFYLKKSGARIHAVLTRISTGDPAARKEEAVRRWLLLEMGIEVVERPMVPFVGYVFNGDHSTDARAIVYTSRAREAPDIALSLTAPVHRDVIQTMWSAVRSSIDPDNVILSYRPVVAATDCDELFGKLRSVHQYSHPRVRFELMDLPTADLFVLSDSIRQYKLRQIEWIAQLYEEESIDRYLPMGFALRGGAESIFTPPIVETHGNDFYVIDGKTRAFAHLGNPGEKLKCVVVRNTDSDLPGVPVRLCDVQVVNRRPPSERFPRDKFRHIEQAVHSW